VIQTSAVPGLLQFIAPTGTVWSVHTLVCMYACVSIYVQSSLTKSATTWQLPINVPNINFYRDPFSGSQAAVCVCTFKKKVHDHLTVLIHTCKIKFGIKKSPTLKYSHKMTSNGANAQIYHNNCRLYKFCHIKNCSVIQTIQNQLNQIRLLLFHQMKGLLT
jgi:hypothetical protein